MKEEIKKFKEQRKSHQEKVVSLNMLLNMFTDGENANNEALKMVDLKFEKSYGETYLNIFSIMLMKENVEEAIEKYKIKRINEHLLKIIKEYKELTDELDEIIFENEEVG